MIEQQQQPVETENDAAQQPAQPYKHKRTAREWVADLQCWLVRRQHHVKRATGQRKKVLKKRMGTLPLIHEIGEFPYALGFQSEYAVVRTGRLLKAAARWAAKTAGGAAARLKEIVGEAARTVLVELFGPFWVFFRGVYNLASYVNGVRRQRGVLAAVWEALCYLGRGIRRYIYLVPRALAYVVPLCALAVFVTVVRTVLNYDYTLAVQVNGQTVGYVESEQVFDSAKEAVDERINYAGTRATSWEIQPTYTLAMSGDVLNEHQMADAILYASSDEIGEGTALYLDGQLAAVTTDGAKLSSYLQSLKAPYEDPSDPSTRVQFNREIELVDGVFFNDSFTDYNRILNYLDGLEQGQVNYTVVAGDSLSLIASKNGLTMAELMACNPGLTTSTALFPGDVLVVGLERRVLQVQIVRTVTRQEEIPYSTETTKSSEYAFGTTKVLQNGVNGLKEVTEDITYDTDGNVLNTVFVNETVLSEPVTKKVVQGTKLPDGQIGTYGSGSFRWPVPNYTYVSRWYGSGHRGADICAPAGTAILAADNGVVVASGWNAAGSNYGYSIIIDHGNGYRTLYAHCISLYVSVGQSVTQGQLIGGVGSTGRSSGNHCHFEIIYGGVKQPPQNWFGTGRRPV